MKKDNILEANICSYGNYSSNNYGAHCLKVILGTRTFYFSYETLVAFRGENSKGEYFFVIHQNDWGNTTGKHLNWICSDKSRRVDDKEFQKQLARFMK